MPEYRRPDIAPRVFHDDAGSVIPYGERWDENGPPEQTYSVSSHPERFAPLHTVADALIEHLSATYDVEIDDDVDPSSLRPPREDVTRAVCLVPLGASGTTAPDAAPITFVFTEFPGVVVHVGALTTFNFPSCGCDACDETWETMADELEATVLAVAAGAFAEELEGPRPPILSYDRGAGLSSDGGPQFSYSLRTAEGTQSGSQPAAFIDRDDLRWARERLAVLATGRSTGGAWRPWRPR